VHVGLCTAPALPLMSKLSPAESPVEVRGGGEPLEEPLGGDPLGDPLGGEPLGEEPLGEPLE
jgi:hypothetical protein